MGAKLYPELVRRLAEDDNAEVNLTEVIIKNKKGKYEHTIYSEEDKTNNL